MSSETIVIVGGGQAGGWAAQTLRAEGFGGRIVLIGDEAHRPYERPPLSKAVLSGDASPDSACLQKPEAFAALNLDWRPNLGATAIDAVSRQVRLTYGEPVAYDKLILCTGGRARRLRIPGADLPAEGQRPTAPGLRSRQADLEHPRADRGPLEVLPPATRRPDLHGHARRRGSAATR